MPFQLTIWKSNDDPEPDTVTGTYDEVLAALVEANQNGYGPEAMTEITQLPYRYEPTGKESEGGIVQTHRG
jgi:hypothetical protein